MLSSAHSSAELLVGVPLKLTVHEVTSVPLTLTFANWKM